MHDPLDQSVFPPELLDQLLKGYSKPEDLTGPDGLLKRLLISRITDSVLGELKA
jgi:hypothetical protein